MQVKPLADNLSVTSQISPEDVPDLARMGFRAIISNRPDGEEADQPAWDELAAQAQRNGMEARHIPVVPTDIGADSVAHFRQALSDLPGPVVAFCRTGTRSAILWALANPGDLSPERRLAIAAKQGYDLSGLRDRLCSATD